MTSMTLGWENFPMAPSQGVVDADSCGEAAEKRMKNDADFAVSFQPALKISGGLCKQP